MCNRVSKNARTYTLTFAVLAGFFTSSGANAQVSYDQSYGYAATATSGFAVTPATPPYTYVPTAINQTSTTTATNIFSPLVPDFASVQSYAGAAGNNHYGLTDVTNGWSATAGIVYKWVNYTAAQSGTLTVNSFVDAGSIGTSIGAGDYSNGISGTIFKWTASLGGAFTHSLDVTTGLQGYGGALSYAPIVTTAYGSTLAGLTSTRTASESSVSWQDTTFTDSISLVAGQTATMLYTINELSAGYYIDDALTAGTCGGDGACGKTWVNFGGIGALDNSISTFDYSFAVDNVTAVPEPSEWALMMVGLGMVGAIARRKNRKHNVI
jgi:PEP-CTERM motif